MNLLKSIFISNYMMAIMAIAGYAGWQLYHGANPLAWGGVLLTAAPILTVISALMIFKNVARTSAHFPTLNLLGFIGVLLAGWGWQNQQTPAAALILAFAGWLGFLIYAYWFSTFGGRVPSGKLIVGAELPYFTVTNAQGETITSIQFNGRPAVLIFFRGNWCPLCMAQVKELVARYKELSDLGVRVALISPQPHENTVALAKKFDVDFDFLTDKGNLAARALGIENRFGTPLGMQMFGYDNDTVLPTVIITDRQGKVVWTDQTDNYRIRPEPDIYLDILRKNAVLA